MTISTELNEIKEYWQKKYPSLLVKLWTNEDSNKFFGMMMGRTSNEDLCADTIGELIAQGEAFLRRTNDDQEK